ncbi:hypothetical protein SCFA_790006 [anaerobic digester metagenome]|uniref:Uncharacterized protein n=1 Tax=anaerobic digester metagenome TaxID=1263854 RepID=A0A485M8C5_9ZZZZ
MFNKSIPLPDTNKDRRENLSLSVFQLRLVSFARQGAGGVSEAAGQISRQTVRKDAV